jgi:hypothetical protein
MRINFTAVVAIIAVVFVVVIGGLILLTITGHDGNAYVSTIGILLTSVASVWLLLRQSVQGRAIETVRHQTNGTLTALRDENLSLRNKLNLALAKLPESHATDVLESTLTSIDEAHK